MSQFYLAFSLVNTSGIGGALEVYLLDFRNVKTGNFKYKIKRDSTDNNEKTDKQFKGGQKKKVRNTEMRKIYLDLK